LLDTLQEWDVDYDGLGAYRATLLRYATEQGQSFEQGVQDATLLEYARESSGWNQ